MLFSGDRCIEKGLTQGEVLLDDEEASAMEEVTKKMLDDKYEILETIGEGRYAK